MQSGWTHGNTPGTVWPPVPAHGKADIGLILGYEMQAGYSTGFLMVEDVVEGSPAHLSAKVKVGHRLMEVDGCSVHGCSLLQTAQKLEGREKSTVSVTLSDPRSNGPQAECRVTFIRRHVVPHYTAALQGTSHRHKVLPVKTQSFGYIRDPHSYDMPAPQVLSVTLAHTHTHTHTHTYAVDTHTHTLLTHTQIK